MDSGLRKIVHIFRPELCLRKVRFGPERRRQLLDLRTAEINRRHQANLPEIRSSPDAVIGMLDRQLAEIGEQIAKATEDGKSWSAKDQLLQSVKGVGPTASQALLAELPELGALDRREIASPIGIAPFNHDSDRLIVSIFRARKTWARIEKNCAKVRNYFAKYRILSHVKPPIITNADASAEP
jgi:hypothetical protein